MKRANIYWYGKKYSNHILIENISDLKEYLENSRGYIRDAAQQIIKRGQKRLGHSTNNLTEICEQVNQLNGTGQLITLIDIISRRNVEQIKHVSKGGKISINSVGGWMPIADDAKIEIIKDFNYSEKDIRIKKWDGGKHYYAFIDNIEVKDDDGDIKWNTYDFAYKMAIKKLKELNDENSL